MSRKSWISGCAGARLTADERGFFADERPWGFILFGRNIEDAAQLADLCAELTSLGDAGSIVPIFVDQEGGRVRRLRPPLAPPLPAARLLGQLHARDRESGLRAAFLHGAVLGASLRTHGINADCIPCLDVDRPDTHSVIGDRALAADPAAVRDLGRAMADGAIGQGVLPVMKHIPGHGRAKADSHLELPRVDCGPDELAACDFLPFAGLRHLPAAMTAHLLYEALDPLWPATLSPTIIEDVIRGRIGFDGLLMTDDISMKALKGGVGALSQLALEAGCDMVLHCNGQMDEMREVAAAVPELSGSALQRAERAASFAGAPGAPPALEAIWAEYQELVTLVA